MSSCEEKGVDECRDEVADENNPKVTGEKRSDEKAERSSGCGEGLKTGAIKIGDEWKQGWK